MRPSTGFVSEAVLVGGGGSQSQGSLGKACLPPPPLGLAAGLLVASREYSRTKSVCLMHNEIKETETLEFGADSGLLQSQARRQVGSCSETPNSLMVLGGKFL